MAGEIESPEVRWRYRIGGKVNPQEALLCSNPSGALTSLVLALPGRLAAYDLRGGMIWESRNALSLRLFGCWDLAADGRLEILAGSSGLSGGRLYLFDAFSGRELWASPASAGSVGAVKVFQPDERTNRRILWLPAATSSLRCYALELGANAPRLVWESRLPNFVSDPYSFSSLAVGSVSKTAGRAIVISGARGNVPNIVLDAATGNELSRSYYSEPERMMESGGAGQLLQLHDIYGDGLQQIVAIASYGSDASYMFQGITVTDASGAHPSRVIESYPVGLRYVAGSVGDFGGSAKTEILVSRYAPDRDKHELLVLDAATLQTKTTLDDFYLSAIVGPVGADGALIIGLTGISTELPAGNPELIAFRYSGGTFQRTAWNPGQGSLAGVMSRAYGEGSMDNPGDAAILLDADGDSVPEILVFDGDRLKATDSTTGATVCWFRMGTRVNMTLLAVRRGPTPADSRVIVAGDDGTVAFLDGGLKELSRIPIGGYFQALPLNGHSSEVAIAADLDGSGSNRILAVDSRNRILDLGNVSRATMEQPPLGRVVWDSGVSQELLALPSAEGGSRLVVRGWSAGSPAVTLLDGEGRPVWSHIFGGATADPPEDAMPVGLNFGHFRPDGRFDLVASAGAKSTFPRITYALSGDTGDMLWRSKDGTFWDGNFAVGDFDHDGIDDVVLNYAGFKGFALNGLTGDRLSGPTIPPAFEELGVIDYNGAPMIAGFGSDGEALVVDGEDDGHLTLLQVTGSADPNSAPRTEVAWAVAQASPDDQRYSMAAAAPTADGDWLIGVGSQSGNLVARRGRDGALVWNVALWNGELNEDNQNHPNPLSSVLAVDINGDGRADFVVGGMDGWLYALDAESGKLLWSLDLGAPVGDPIAADLEGKGRVQILAPSADGYLNAIAPRLE